MYECENDIMNSTDMAIIRLLTKKPADLEKIWQAVKCYGEPYRYIYEVIKLWEGEGYVGNLGGKYCLTR